MDVAGNRNVRSTQAKVRDREDALASTPEACAPRNSLRDVVELLYSIGLTDLSDVTGF
jgi:hypothetical protein